MRGVEIHHLLGGHRRVRFPPANGAGQQACWGQAAEIIAELLAGPEVELVHLRNVGYGCYNFAVRASG